MPYQPNGYIDHLEFDANNKILVWINMYNQGAPATKSAAFSIYANQYRTGGPWQYTVAPGGSTNDYFNVGSSYGNGKYDLTLLGPNRFLRHFAGNATTAGKAQEVTTSYQVEPGTGKLAIYFHMTNTSTSSVTFTITSNQYRYGRAVALHGRGRRHGQRLLQRGRVQQRLVRLLRHGQRRHRVDPAFRRSPGDRYGQRHRLVGPVGQRSQVGRCAAVNK